MAKSNSYNSGMRILKTLEYLHNLPEPDPGKDSVPVKPTELARYLTNECGETTRATAKEILNAIMDSDTGYLLSYSKSEGGQDQYSFRRTFTLEQISLLSTIISSSIFLNESEINTLLTQLKSLTSAENAEALSKSDHFLRPRMMNDDALKNLRTIHEAINNKQALRFYVGKFDAEMHIYYEKPIRGKTDQLKRITFGENGTTEKIVDKLSAEYGLPIICCPYALAWDNSRCYLICGVENDDKIRLWNYRVDRMFELKTYSKMTYREPISSPYYDLKSKSINAERYLHSIFKMFPRDTSPALITLRFRRELTRVIVEKFGFDVKIIPKDETYAQTTVEVQISRQFYGWLAGFHADDLCMTAPQSEIDEYINYLKETVEIYL